MMEFVSIELQSYFIYIYFRPFNHTIIRPLTDWPEWIPALVLVSVLIWLVLCYFAVFTQSQTINVLTQILYS